MDKVEYDRILPDFMDTMIPLDLPPLAERKEDIPILIRTFVDQFNRVRTAAKQPEERRPSKECLDLDRISQLLTEQDWSHSNISGLRMVVEEVLLKTPTPVVTPEDFERALKAITPQPGAEPEEASREAAGAWKKPERHPIIITEEDMRRYGLH